MNYSVLGFMISTDKQSVYLYNHPFGIVNGFSRIIKDDEAPFSVMSDVFHKKTGVKQEYWSVFAEVITPDLTITCFWCLGELQSYYDTTPTTRIEKAPINQLNQYNLSKHCDWLIPMAVSCAKSNVPMFGKVMF